MGAYSYVVWDITGWKYEAGQSPSPRRWLNRNIVGHVHRDGRQPRLRRRCWGGLTAQRTAPAGRTARGDRRHVTGVMFRVGRNSNSDQVAIACNAPKVARSHLITNYNR